VKSILQDLFRLQALDIQGLPTRESEAKNLRGGIPAALLNNYDRARARGRKGIAILRDRVCTNCRMQSPIAVTVGLTAGTVQVCGNCGLYLCLDPDQPISPQPEATQTAKRRSARKAAGVKASS
jgi:predicted  nucleic acid-binding Zn-ribbon protein